MPLDTPNRLYPLFAIENIQTSTPLNSNVIKKKSLKPAIKKKTPVKVNSATKSKKRQWRVAFDENQAQIDAGQKKFGTKECTDCGLLYQQHEPEDEYNHQVHHDTTQNLAYPGWKNEKIVARFGLDYVVLVRYSDTLWTQKANKIIDYVDKELGYAPADIKISPNTHVYLYIRKKKVVGCLIAAPMDEAYRFLPEQSTDDIGCVAQDSVPVKCGISRLWTLKSQRRKHVATNLLQTVRSNFLPGKILTVDDISFAMPLFIEGRRFLQRYCNRSDFLVYTGLAL